MSGPSAAPILAAMGLRELAVVLVLIGAGGLLAMQVFATDDALWTWSLVICSAGLVPGGALLIWLESKKASISRAADDAKDT